MAGGVFSKKSLKNSEEEKLAATAEALRCLGM